MKKGTENDGEPEESDGGSGSDGCVLCYLWIWTIAIPPTFFRGAYLTKPSHEHRVYILTKGRSTGRFKHVNCRARLGDSLLLLIHQSKHRKFVSYSPSLSLSRRAVRRLSNAGERGANEV